MGVYPFNTERLAVAMPLLPRYITSILVVPFPSLPYLVTNGYILASYFIFSSHPKPFVYLFHLHKVSMRVCKSLRTTSL